MGMTFDLFRIPQDVAQNVLKHAETVPAILERQDSAMRGVGLEKSWHGLDYVLTSLSGNAESVSFLLATGEPWLPRI
jgi:hypothetical protein